LSGKTLTTAQDTDNSTAFFERIFANAVVTTADTKTELKGAKKYANRDILKALALKVGLSPTLKLKFFIFFLKKT
jgi:hypothetical protein